MTSSWKLTSSLARLAFVALVSSLALTQSCSCEQTCVASSECADGACVEGVCNAGVDPCSLCSENQGCSEEGDCLGSCVGGFVWTGSACELPEGCADCANQNRTCNAADETCDGCVDGYQEWQGNCVPLMTCDPPPAADSLAEDCEALGRECTVTADGALCGECLPDYAETGEACEEDRSCTDAALAAECAAENRECLEAPNGHCGDCLPFFLEEDNGTTSTCRAAIRCSEITCDTACTDATETTDAFCAEPCTGATGRDGVTNAQGNCVECGACDGVGEDGPYLVSLYAGQRCICKSDPGYYYDDSANETTPCDADGDGWTRKSAQRAYESSDQVLQATMGCDVREVTAFELRAHDGSTKTETVDDPVPLFEEVRNDSQQELNLANLQPYGGRELKAEELNGLTKACVGSGPTADYNANGADDVDEYQGMGLPGGTSIHTPLIDYTYFVELHRGYFVPPSTYVIEEKSRALDAPAGKAVPLTVPDSEGAFWRQCSVFEDPGYDADLGLGIVTTTYDFAQYTEASPAFVMGHHSQFKCLRIVSTTPVTAPPHHITLSTLGGDEYFVNDCQAEGTDATPISDDPIGDARNPKDPVISCVSRDGGVGQTSGLVNDDAVWAVRRYLDYDVNTPYLGGCVDECVEFKDRCPGYDPAVPTKTKCDGTIGDYGKLTCGCDISYGGPACDLGCPDQNLMYQADVNGQQPYTLAPRSGYWMCGGITASSNPELAEPVDGGPDGQGGQLEVGYRLRGAVPATVTPTTRLCEDIDAGPGGDPCSLGYSLGPSSLP